jgi:hypothetical protein
MNAIAVLRRSTTRTLARAGVGLTATVLALAAGLPTPAQATTAQEATLYQDINYGGPSASFFTNNNYPDLSSIGWNDRASSIRVSPGTVVAVYSDINFAGRCETIRADDADLRNNTVGNDTISSLQVGAACPVVMWNGTNYTGAINWASGDIPDLGYQFSDLVSSVKTQGNKVALYDLPNYGGVCENLTADDPDLGNNPIGHRASSLRIGVDCPVQAVLYADINYGGDYRMVAVNNSPTYLESAWADRASSIHVTSGGILDAQNHFTTYSSTIGYQFLVLCSRFRGDNPDLRTNIVGNDGIDTLAAYNHEPTLLETISCL